MYQTLTFGLKYNIKELETFLLGSLLYFEIKVLFTFVTHRSFERQRERQKEKERERKRGKEDHILNIPVLKPKDYYS